MVFNEPDLGSIFGKYLNLIKLSWAEIDKLRNERKSLKWYNFLKKREIDVNIYAIQEILGGIGFQKACEDLENAGLLKKVK